MISQESVIEREAVAPAPSIPDMDRHVRFIAFVMYLPQVLNVLWWLVPFDVVIWNNLASGIMLGTALSRTVVWDTRTVRWLAIFCLCFVLIGSVNFVREGKGLMVFLARHSGAFMALALASYVTVLAIEERRYVFGRMIPIMAMVVCGQCLFSVYESMAGEEYIIQSYDWNTSGGSYELGASGLQDRLQIGLILSQASLPFNMTFTGMLGQHNHWGTQLPFYNLVFLWLFFQQTKRPWWLTVMPAIMLVAAILNTSRFGIIAILLTDIIFMLQLSRIRRAIKMMMVGIPLVLLLINADEIIELGTTYVSLTNTFEGRLENWEGAWPQVLTRGVIDIGIGSTRSTIQSIQRQFEWEDFENLALTLLMEKGVITFALFLIWLLTVVTSAHAVDRVTRTTLYLIVVCMVIVSLWSNVLLRSTSFGIVAFLVCCLAPCDVPDEHEKRGISVAA